MYIAHLGHDLFLYDIPSQTYHYLALKHRRDIAVSL